MSPSRRLQVVLVAAVGIVAVVASSSPASGPARPVVALRILVSDGAGHRASASVSCRGSVARATGYLGSRAGAACRQARRIAGFLTGRPPVGRQCTQIYGGPDTARITGRIGSGTVDRGFARSDGCAIGDWARAGVLLPASRFAG